MNREQRRAARKALDSQLPNQLTKVPREQWPQPHPPRLEDVWRSKKFFVQLFRERDGIIRLSINRTERDGNSWKDGITWDELQSIKNDVGFSDFDAIEVYPRADDVVNVANIRHIWVMPALVPLAWRKERQEAWC